MNEALPDLLLPYQQELWREIDANQVVVDEKSRRTGMSYGVAAVAAEYAARARSAGGMDVLYMGYEREMTREFIDYVAEWAKVFQIGAKEVQEFVFRDPDKPEKDVGAFRIKFASGFEVIALPSMARALRGKQGLVILDEAAFMDDLEAVLKAAFALLIWGGKVVVISTHNGETNPFNTLVEDIRAGRAPYKLLRLTFDEALAQGLYRRVCFKAGKTWTQAAEDEWRQEILAIYRDNADEELHVIPNPVSGVYLPGALLEARQADDVHVVRWACSGGFTHLAEHLREAECAQFCRAELDPILSQLHADTPHAFGEDFGRVRDLTVIWVVAILKTMERRSRLVLELRNVPFEQQRQILFYIVDRLPRFRAGKMDASGNGAYLAEVAMQRYGERIEPVKIVENWYRENMPPMKAGIEDAMFTLPRDRDLIDDLRMLKLVRGVARVPERARTAENGSRHGDGAIAACMAYAASRAEPELYGYRAAERRNAVDGASASLRSFMFHRDEDDDRRAPSRELRGTI